MASSSGSNLGTGGAFFPQPQQKRRGTNSDGRIGRGFGSGGDGAGAASIQGGAGGGGRGGYIHVYDHRNPPDYGRIPWPEDIFGSLEVDSSGNFVDGNGRYQSSGTYRIITREGWYVQVPVQVFKARRSFVKVSASAPSLEKDWWSDCKTKQPR